MRTKRELLELLVRLCGRERLFRVGRSSNRGPCTRGLSYLVLGHEIYGRFSLTLCRCLVEFWYINTYLKHFKCCFSQANPLLSLRPTILIISRKCYREIMWVSGTLDISRLSADLILVREIVNIIKHNAKILCGLQKKWFQIHLINTTIEWMDMKWNWIPNITVCPCNKSLGGLERCLWMTLWNRS